MADDVCLTEFIFCEYNTWGYNNCKFVTLTLIKHALQDFKILRSFLILLKVYSILKNINCSLKEGQITSVDSLGPKNGFMSHKKHVH